MDEPVRPVAATGLTAQSAENTDSVAKKIEDQDMRVPIISYLKDPGRGAERNIRRAAFKYILIDDELYHRTAKDLHLKCLDSDHAKVAMGQVDEGICGTNLSAPKIKWLLRRAGFYWFSMISDCVKYYKGCEGCQWFGDLQLVPAASLHPIIKPWPFRGWGWILLDKLILHLQRGIASC